ncbi:MAG: YafY family protein, partial [Clostridia bacterium]
VDVCFGILIELLSKRKVSARYLSEKFEISIRTVYRYIDILSANHIAVFATRGRNGGIQIADNYRLPAGYLTIDEQSDIFSALTLLSSATTNSNAENIKTKLLALNTFTKADNIVMSSDKLYVDGDLIGDETLYRNKVEPLKKAIDLTQMVSIVYHDRGGEISLREIEPHAFVLKNLVWYVYAYCHLRNGFRMFKISRIEKLLVMPEKPFIRRERASFTPWNLENNNEYKSINLLLLLKNSVRYDIEEWLGIECISKNENLDWPYSASATVKSNDTLISRLLSFGSEIMVVEPLSLKEKTISSAKNLIKLYNS